MLTGRWTFLARAVRREPRLPLAALLAAAIGMALLLAVHAPAAPRLVPSFHRPPSARVVPDARERVVGEGRHLAPAQLEDQR